MRLTALELARVNAAFSVLVDGHEHCRHSSVLKWLLVVDPDATDADVVHQLECSGYDPACPFDAAAAQRYLQAAKSRVLVQVMDADSTEFRAEHLGNAIPLFATISSARQLQDMQLQSPVAGRMGSAGARQRAHQQQLQLQLQPPPRANGSLNLWALVEAMRRIPVLNELRDWSDDALERLAVPPRVDDDDGEADTDRRSAGPTPSLQSEVTSGAASPQSPDSQSTSPGGRSHVAASKRKKSAPPTFDELAAWVAAELKWLGSAEGLKAAKVLASQAPPIPPPTAEQLEAHQRQHEEQRASFNQSQQSIMSVSEGDLPNRRLSHTQLTPAPPGQPAAAHHHGMSSSASTSRRRKKRPTSLPTAFVSYSAVRAAGLRHFDRMPKRSAAQSVAAQQQQQQQQLEAQKQQDAQEQGEDVGVFTIAIPGGDIDSLQDGGDGPQQQQQQQHPQHSEESVRLKRRVNEAYDAMHSRVRAPVKVVVPPARRLPPPPTLICNELDRELRWLINRHNNGANAAPSPSASPRTTSLAASGGSVVAVASSPNASPGVQPIALGEGLHQSRREVQPTRPAVDRSTNASTARERARRTEFPDIALQSATPTKGQQGSTPRSRTDRATDASSSAASTPRRIKKAPETNVEAAQRAARMRFFADQSKFTQPFRAEFKNANLAPPSDTTTLPEVAKTLIGAKPYTGFESLTLVSPKRARAGDDDATNANADKDAEEEDEEALMERWVQ